MKLHKRYQITFVAIILCFFIPSSIYCIVCAESLEIDPEMLYWSLGTIILTTFIDIMIILLSIAFLVSQSIQIGAAFGIIRFLTTTNKARIGLSVGFLVLSLIYMHGVIFTLTFFWGYPAFEMTGSFGEGGRV